MIFELTLVCCLFFSRHYRNYFIDTMNFSSIFLSFNASSSTFHACVVTVVAAATIDEIYNRWKLPAECRSHQIPRICAQRVSSVSSDCVPAAITRCEKKETRPESNFLPLLWLLPLLLPSVAATASSCSRQWAPLFFFSSFAVVVTVFLHLFSILVLLWWESDPKFFALRRNLTEKDSCTTVEPPSKVTALPTFFAAHSSDTVITLADPAEEKSIRRGNPTFDCNLSRRESPFRP